MVITSSVITNAVRHSLTFKNVSGSFCSTKAEPIAEDSRDTTASQSSSISRSERKPEVVSSTWDSIMKKPHISSKRAGREGKESGVGRIRSDWA